jgi:hypothetical protein
MPVSEEALKGKLRRKQAQDLLRRGLLVQAEARRLLSGATRHPRRVNTGLLRSSIRVQLTAWHGHPAVRIGTNVTYARYVRRGTGIYGPFHRPIVPKHKKALAFTSKKYGRVVVRSVKGMQKNDFLRDALPKARG